MVTTGTGVGVTKGAGVFVGFAVDVIEAVVDGNTGVESSGAQEDRVAGRSQPASRARRKNTQITEDCLFTIRSPI